MSGISGVISNQILDFSKGFNMIQDLSHRGSDSVKNYQDEEIALFHTQLAISENIDKQQLVFSRGKNIISTTNGKIVNTHLLASSLQKFGYQYTDKCDTNIIPHLYEAYGTKMFTMLNGSFAIAIWDRKNKKLILARDRFGEKPLYYRQVNQAFYFCSELQPLIKICAQNKKNITCLKDICTTWGTIGKKTVYEDIYSIDSGEYLVLQDEKVTTRSYYKPIFKANNRQKSKTKLVEELDVLLNQSITDLMNKDGSTAFYLSGGLDSSLITAIAAKQKMEKINSFSITFSERHLDETNYQNKVANLLGSQHHSLHVTNEMIVNRFCDIVEHLQIPILRLGCIPMYLMAEFVHQNGFKDVLSGEGADELFGGYDIFKEAKIREFCKQDPDSKLRPLLYQKTNQYIHNFGHRNAAALSTFYNQVSTKDLFASHALRFQFGNYCNQFFSADAKAELINYSVTAELAKSFPTEFGSYSSLASAQYLEIKTFMSNYLLSIQGDRASMAHGVECHYPFLDQRLVLFASQLNDYYKINGLNEKYLLKELAKKYLPNEILQRKKFPYRVMLDSKSLLNNERISSFISEAHIKKQNVFNNIAVTQFINKLRKKDQTTEKELMLLLFIISTQIVFTSNQTSIYSKIS